ncbi:MAG: hypothetical protein V1834_00220, partial [Candidatus Micrarchaeota archaeon]
ALLSTMEPGLKSWRKEIDNHYNSLRDDIGLKPGEHVLSHEHVVKLYEKFHALYPPDHRAYGMSEKPLTYDVGNHFVREDILSPLEQDDELNLTESEQRILRNLLPKFSHAQTDEERNQRKKATKALEQFEQRRIEQITNKIRERFGLLEQFRKKTLKKLSPRDSNVRENMEDGLLVQPLSVVNSMLQIIRR